MVNLTRVTTQDIWKGGQNEKLENLEALLVQLAEVGSPLEVYPYKPRGLSLLPTRVVDIPDLVKREYRISTNMGYINMINAWWSKCITTAKTTWWICVLNIKYITLYALGSTRWNKYIMLFLSKKIFGGLNLCAARTCIHPSPLSSFFASLQAKMRRGALTRCENLGMFSGTREYFLKKYYIIFCNCNMLGLRQQIHI